MAEAYSIGVKIAMSGNVTSFLNTMAQALTGAHLKAKDLEGSLNRAKLALGGMASVAAGVGIAKFLIHTTDKAKELSHQLVQIKKLGIDAAQFSQVKAGAISATKTVQGVTQVDALKAYGASYSIFGHADALKMIPAITRFEQVLGNTTGNYEKASENVYSLIRAGELMGQFVDHVTHKVDVTKLESFLDFASRAALATHGKVGPETWLNMAQQGGPALSSMSREGLMTMVAVAQAMGGHRAGTALMSAAQQFLGGTTTQRTAEAARKYGLVGDYDVRRGGKVVFREGALNTDFIKATRDDPLDAMKIAQRALARKGLTNVEDQVPELYKIFGRQTTQRMFHDLLRNMPQIEAEKGRLKGAMGIQAADKTANEEDYSKVLHNLSAAWKDFNATIGQSETAIRIMTTLTGALKGLTDWAHENPGTAAVIGQGLAAVAAGLTVMGGVAVAAAFAAFAPAGAAAAGIAGIVAAVGALVALNWDTVKGGLTSIKDALLSFVEAIASLPGKIMKAIAGIFSINPGPSMGKEQKFLPGAVPPERFAPGMFPTLKNLPDQRSEAGGLSRMAWNAPPRSQTLRSETTVVLDGQVVSRSVVSQILRDNEHVTSAPHHDGMRGYVGPDAQFATA